jgi:ADP-ribose pyrophosphatase YjhB (NUDIX family)
MIKQMTNLEKENLKTKTFEELWKIIWGTESLSNQYKTEEFISREKFNSLRMGVLTNDSFYTLDDMLRDSSQFPDWIEPEWGFPKGRRNYQEKDYECALREFIEETGFPIEKLHNIKNILPFEEIFTGSNYKSYKHKYYLTFMQYDDTLDMGKFETSEVSKMEWKTFDECLSLMRPYNLEKKRVLSAIDKTLQNFRIFSM